MRQGSSPAGKLLKQKLHRLFCLQREFPDHHPYSEQDHRDLLGLLSDVDRLVTTEKDAVKIRRYPWPEGKLLFVRLDLVLEDEQAFWERLETKGVLVKRGDAR